MLILVPSAMAGTHPALTPRPPGADNEYTCHFLAETGHQNSDGCPTNLNTLVAPDLHIGFHNNDAVDHRVVVTINPSGAPSDAVFEECLAAGDVSHSAPSYNVGRPTDPGPNIGNGDGTVTIDAAQFPSGGSFRIDWYDTCLPCPPEPLTLLVVCAGPSKTTGGPVGSL